MKFIPAFAKQILTYDNNCKTNIFKKTSRACVCSRFFHIVITIIYLWNKPIFVITMEGNSCSDISHRG